MAVLELDRLGLVERHVHPVRNVAGQVVATDCDDGHVPDRSLDEDGHVSRAAANVNHDDAHLTLLRRQHSVAGSQRVEDEAVDLQAGARHGILQVGDAGGERGDDVCFQLQTEAVHADRAAHPFLAVERILARHHVQHLAIVRDGDGARGLQHPAHVFAVDGALARDADHAAVAAGGNVIAGDADKGAVDDVAAAAFGLVHGLRDRAGQGLNVADDALLHAARGARCPRRR